MLNISQAKKMDELKCCICGRPLQKRWAMHVMKDGKLQPAHRDCSLVWYYDEEGRKIGGAEIEIAFPEKKEKWGDFS